MQNPLKKTLFALYVLVIVCMAAATVVEKYSGTDFVRSNVYGAWWFSLLWAVLTAAGIIYFLRHRCKSWSGIALHLSFVVILAGAFVTHVSSERGTVHLRQGAYISTCVMYDRHNQPHDVQMPFQMRLDRFDVQYHEGTDAAEDYVSQFTIIDHGKQYSGKVSMNRIFRYGAMRFYQSSYDNDMLGASVSFNSDPIGIPLTYTGYALLFFSLVYMLLDPHGAYRKLLRLSHLKKGLMMMALRSGSLLKLFPYTNKGKTTWFAPTDDLPNAMDREHQQFVRSICLLLGDCALASDYTQMDAVVGKMLKYQQKNGGASMPSDRRVAAERIYNRIPFATILFMLCLAMGIISFLYAIIRMCREDNGANNVGTDADPVLNSPLLSVHVSIIMMGFAMLSFTFVSGLTALLLRLVSRTAQPKMVQLQQLSLVFLYPALAALGIGIFIGAIWANVSWGEYWGWDPKEVWALITFMIYAIPLHARSVAQLRRPTAFHLFMTLAFLTLVMTYFGVNYFLGGMHSYA